MKLKSPAWMFTLFAVKVKFRARLLGFGLRQRSTDMAWVMTLASNLWKLQIDRFFGDFWIYAPLLVPFFKTQGLDATEIFLIEATYNIMMSVTEVPTGYFADVVGRKKALMVGAVLLPIAIMIYLYSSGFWGFVFAEACVGFAASLRSGTDSAMLYDTLTALGREREHKKIEGKAHFYTNIGTSTASVLGGFLSMISLKMPFIANMGTVLVLLPLSFSLTEPPHRKTNVKSLRDHFMEIRRAFAFCLRHKTVLLAGLCLALIANVSVVGLWSYYFYLGELKLSTAFYGFLGALVWVFSSIGARLCHKITHKIGDRAVLWLLLLIAPSLVAISQIRTLWAFPFMALNAVLWGLSIPLLRDIIHRHTRSSRRSTVLSVINMTRRMSFIAFAFLVGQITDASNIHDGMFVLSLCFIALGTPIVLQLTKRIA